MSISLYLRSIHHQAAVADGRALVREALQTGDASPLRSYLLHLDVDIRPDLIAERQEHLAKLRELKAPSAILESEEGMLEELRGLPYSRDVLDEADLETLRDRLARWCWLARSVQIAYWDPLLWYASDVWRDQAEEQATSWEELLEPTDRWARDIKRYPVEAALLGCQSWPRAHDGRSLIGDGDDKFDDVRYNAPVTVVRLSQILLDVKPDWEGLFEVRCQMHRAAHQKRHGSAQLGLGPEVEKRCILELEAVQGDFQRVQHAYGLAASKEFGVCCSYV